MRQQKPKGYFLMKASPEDVDGFLHMMIYCFDPWHADRSLKSLSSFKRARCKSHSPQCRHVQPGQAPSWPQQTQKQPGIPFFQSLEDSILLRASWDWQIWIRFKKPTQIITSKECENHPHTHVHKQEFASALPLHFPRVNDPFHHWWEEVC